MKPDSIITHPYWGNITDSLRANGYTSDIKFSHPFFGTKIFPVYLGQHTITHTPNYIREHPGQYYKPIEEIFGKNYYLLDEFMKTHKDFMLNIDDKLATLQQKLFDHFEQHLAAQLPLIFEESPVIESIEAHNEYIKNLDSIRLLENGQIKFLFYYDLYPSPIFPVVFVDGQLEDL